MRFRNIYLYGIALLLFVSVSVLRAIAFRKMNRFTEEVNNARETISELEKLSSNFKSAQLYSPKYEKQISSRYYLFLKMEAMKIEPKLQRIPTLIRDSVSLKLFDSVSYRIHNHLPALIKMNIVELISAGESWRLDDIFKVESLVSDIVVREEAQLTMKRKELDTSIEQTGLITSFLTTIASLIIVIAFISNFRLFSRRMWLEEFLQSILNSSLYGVISYKVIRNRKRLITDFSIEFANPAIEELVGYKPEQIVGKRISDFTSFFSDYFHVFASVIDTGKKQTFEVKTQAGNWLYMLLAKNGERLTASFQDISPLKNYQAELETTVQKLETTNAELEQYAYAASHDLQEPLRKINIFSNLLQERGGTQFDEKEKEYLKKIVNATGRMTTLVTDLLSFSSLKKHEEFVQTDLNESLLAVLEDLDLVIQQKQAIIRHDNLPVIEAIPLQMQQIFYNLVNNGLKFTRDGTIPELTISCRILDQNDRNIDPRLAKDKEYVELNFQDNGIGFSNQYASQIFGLFKRLHSKDAYKGSGIGLALCQRVAENHHGYIYAKGEPGVGASFFVILPTKQLKA
ncbi:MAG TPA: ATP-binding protein [Flavitalea sp.]|nr:ATP-binding protein [Flavitalea sp.]